jgi:hypothetical protein
MKWPNQAQINTALRYGGTAVSAIGAGAVVLGALPADKAHAIVEQAQKVLTDLQNLVGDSAYLATLLFPVIIGALARIGWNSASKKSQVAAVEANGDTHVVTTNENLAKSVPGVEVVTKLP